MNHEKVVLSLHSQSLDESGGRRAEVEEDEEEEDNVGFGGVQERKP